MDLQVSTIFVSLSMFLFAVKHPTFNPLPILTSIGYISQYVYIFHLPIIVLAQALLNTAYPNNYQVFLPYVVILMTVSFSFLYNGTIKKVFVQKRTTKET